MYRSSSLLGSMPRITRTYHFWLVVVMFAIGVVLHYPQQILSTDSPSLFSFLGLTRHAAERVLLLLPVIYAGFFLGTKAGLVSLTIALAIMLPRDFLVSLYLPDALFETGGVLVIGGLVNLWFYMHRRDITRLKSAEKNLHYYLQEITKVQEAERERIARELHDDTVQNLIALLHQLDNFLNERVELPEADAKALWDLHERIRDILQEVRRFSRDLRPSILDDLGLLPALEWITEEFKTEYGIESGFIVAGNKQKLSQEAELLLFRIVQEALRNIAKHAQASKTEVKVEFDKNKIRINISDNGIGFQPPVNLGALPRMGKLGLAGIQERIQLLGGSLEIKSELGRGTTVFVEAPIQLWTDVIHILAP